MISFHNVINGIKGLCIVYFGQFLEYCFRYDLKQETKVNVCVNKYLYILPVS